MPYHHFNTAERDALQATVNMKLPKWAIAVILGKRLSSIYRELGRNSNSGVYTSREAQILNDERRAETKPRPKMANERLMAEVMEMFKKDYSPDQIAGRLAEKRPDEPEIWVSAETIYGYLYEKAAQDKELRRYFRHPRPYRQKRGGGYGRGSRQKRVYSYFCRQDNKIAPCKMDAEQNGDYAE